MVEWKYSLPLRRGAVGDEHLASFRLDGPMEKIALVARIVARYMQEEIRAYCCLLRLNRQGKRRRPSMRVAC